MLPTLPTPGILLLDAVPICFTLELPWLDNQEDISCIPTGTYSCLKRIANTQHLLNFETYQVLNVPGRSGILFHVGNTVKDTKGCILVGNAFDINNPSLMESVPAFQKFMTSVGDSRCFLDIVSSPSFYQGVSSPQAA
jgi:hypothetical protein